MNITPINLDYLTAPLDDIVKGEVSRINLLLEDLKEEGRLCGEAGRYLIAQFKFKGDMDAVIKEAEEYIEHLKTNGLTDAERVPFDAQLMRGNERYYEEKDEVESREEFKTSMKNGDTESMFIALNRTLNIRDNMHNKKECICYCN